MALVSKSVLVVSSISVALVASASAEDDLAPAFIVALEIAEEGFFANGEPRVFHVETLLPAVRTETSLLKMPISVDNAYLVSIDMSPNGDATCSTSFSICHQTEDGCTVIAEPSITTNYGQSSSMEIAAAAGRQIFIAMKPSTILSE